jgi:hypothetical protein
VADEITLERDIDEILGDAQTVEGGPDQDDTKASAAEPEDDEESEDGGEDED